MKHLLSKIKATLKQLNFKSLWPSTCLLCQLPSHRTIDLCMPCEAELPWLTHSCQRCAAPLEKQYKPTYCGACIKKAPVFDSAHALFFYTTPIDHFIKQLKFKYSLATAQVFGQLMAEKMEAFYSHTLGPLQSKPEVLIPVPLHSQRLKTRGFNQALELARPISKLLKIPIDYHTCQRLKNTKAQMELSFTERRENIKNAFVLAKTIKASSVCIIDDVMTTSNTVLELSRILKLNGVSKVEIWCCARASKV